MIMWMCTYKSILKTCETRKEYNLRRKRFRKTDWWNVRIASNRERQKPWERDGKQLIIDKLEEENKKLKEELAKQYDWANWLFDEIEFWKREAKRLWWKTDFMEDDTLQELKDIWEI